MECVVNSKSCVENEQHVSWSEESGPRLKKAGEAQDHKKGQ